MPRHIACLTFDFDAMSGMIANGLTSPTPISRGEFGVIGVRAIESVTSRTRAMSAVLQFSTIMSDRQLVAPDIRSHLRVAALSPTHAMLSSQIPVCEKTNRGVRQSCFAV